MKRFIGKLAALSILGTGMLANLVVTTSALAAHGYERFDTGNKTPHDLALKLRSSLSVDRNGYAPVDPARCKPNGDSCARPIDYLAMFQKADPNEGLTSVAQLPDYVDTLVPVKPPDEKTWMGCMEKPHGELMAVWDCMSRTFHKGKGEHGEDETVWRNPKTGKGVLARDCTNPVGEPDVRDCDEIWVYIKPQTGYNELHAGLLGPQAMPPDKCFALKRAGEDEWIRPVLDWCPRERCDYSRPAAFLHLMVQETPRISFTAEREGWYILRVGRFVEKSPDVFEFCLLNPTTREQSEGKDMHKTAYGTFGRAYIVYGGPNEAKPPADWRGVPHVWLFKGSRF